MKTDSPKSTTPAPVSAKSEGTIPDSNALTLGDQSMGGQLGEAILNLEGFSRRDRSTPESCR